MWIEAFGGSKLVLEKDVSEGEAVSGLAKNSKALSAFGIGGEEEV